MTPQEQLRQMSEALQRAADNKARARQEAEKSAVFGQIGQYLSAALQPMHKAVEEMKRIGHSIGMMSSRLNNLELQTPEVRVDLSSLHMPTPNITVKPIIDIPEVKMPGEMEVKGWINLMGYDRGLLTNPLPVQLRDAKGNPVKLFENLTQILGGGGGGWGGGSNHVVVDSMPSFSVSVAAATNTTVSLVNADGVYYDSANPLPITGSISTTPGATFYASDAIGSVNIIQIGGNSIVVGTGYQDNAIRVVNATDAVTSVNIVSGATGGTQYDDAGNAAPGTGGLVMARDSAGSVYAARIGSGTSETALRVLQASDSVASVNIVSSAQFNVFNYPLYYTHAEDAFDYVKRQAGESTSALRVVQATDAVGSVNVVSSATLPVIQVSGAVSSTNLLQVGGNAVVVGTGYQDNALRVVHATDAIASVNIVSSATLTVTGSLTSSVVVGSVVADAIDDGSAPVQMGGVARTANPTAVAGGDVVKASMDDVGRQLVRPVQVRDLIQTARATLTNGTETTLLTGSAGVFNDLIYVMAANNSDAAASVDFRSATAANIQFTIQVPANGTAGMSLPVPIPQDVAADTWTADMADITGTTISISALFSKEV